ncbi:MAG: N-acetyl-gamma-glutamyl-phosphate reductase [Lewinellaceae bacterium]|nr:N-acetyl-gamma-glutamyl-phosphate reductase [Lewinellaceae bacterium]
MIKTGIIGATGYTGSELVRLLYNHPEVAIESITSESRSGERFSDVHPQFKEVFSPKLEPAAAMLEKEVSLVFLALPHGVSMNHVKPLADAGIRLIDLSGDFRLSSPAIYQQWYGQPHSFPEGITEAIYGLPELHREEIRKARIVANPGCYPTSAILGLAPLQHAGLIAGGQAIVDAKSGVTGAGVKAKPGTHFSNVNDNFKAYGLKRHRHTIEIEEQLSGQGKGDVRIQFTPHLLPVDRGILATIYCRPTEEIRDGQLRELYQAFYQGHPFVRLRDEPPTLKDVRGSNFCDIFSTYDERTHQAIVISVIDNLVKGAAGQAVQNMNLMMGLEETLGLPMVPLNP